MPTSLVVGASRGIGLDLCRLLLQRGDHVLAVCRAPSAALERLGIRLIQGTDVANPQDARQLAEKLRGVTIDLLIHNAGMFTAEALDDLDFERVLRQFEVNALGPLRVVHALLGNLQAGAKIGIVSSRAGSLSDNASGGNYGYRMSKAAVNMAGVNLAHDLRPRGIKLMLLHPGLVATDMTGGAGMEPSAAAGGIIARLDELTLEGSGAFWHAEGYQLPW